jgi:hypothetical protein
MKRAGVRYAILGIVCDALGESPYNRKISVSVFELMMQRSPGTYDIIAWMSPKESTAWLSWFINP